jgi:hypothetical protein
MDFHAGSKKATAAMTHGTIMALRQEDILPIGNALPRIVPQTWTKRAELVVVNRNRNPMPLQFLNRLS